MVASFQRPSILSGAVKEVGLRIVDDKFEQHDGTTTAPSGYNREDRTHILDMPLIDRQIDGEEIACSILTFPASIVPPFPGNSSLIFPFQPQREPQRRR